jgi:hypothetical protein
MEYFMLYGEFGYVCKRDDGSFGYADDRFDAVRLSRDEAIAVLRVIKGHHTVLRYLGQRIDKVYGLGSYRESYTPMVRS